MGPDELPLIPTIEALVGEIEQDAGTPIERLSDAQLQPYLRKLDEIDDARRPPLSPETLERAEHTLQEIRREFGYAA